MTDMDRLTGAELKRLIEFSTRTCPWTLPMLTAAQHGVVNLMMVPREATVPVEQMQAETPPIFAWVGDDDALPTGPAGWKDANVLTGWARSAIIHAAAGERVHYEEAVLACLALGRLLFVETTTAHLAAWSAMLMGKPVLHVVPRGGVHPIMKDTRQ